MIDTILLCGGLGTRAQDYLGNKPKCLAEVAGRPVLDHILRYLRTQGILRVCLAMAAGREEILEHIGPSPRKCGTLTIHADLDHEQRGTAGAVLHVLKARLATDTPFEAPLLILNGDTLFRLNIALFFMIHLSEQGDYTTAVSGATPFARLLGSKAIKRLTDPGSLEEALPVNRGIVYHTAPGAFVDIGTYDGYAKAEEWVKLYG